MMQTDFAGTRGTIRRTGERRSRVPFPAVAVLCLLSSLFAPALRADLCDVQYDFLSASRDEWGNVSYLIGTKVEGPCEAPPLFELKVSPPESRAAGVREYGNIGYVNLVENPSEPGGENRQSLNAVPLTHTNGTWITSDMPWGLISPEFDSDVHEFWRKYRLRGGTVSGWRAEYGLRGIVWPELVGARGDLIYIHGGGLYFNYHVAAAYYFPETRHLMILTKQALHDENLHSQNGFLLFRVSESAI
ncbi:MAG: hypothetical protein HKN20_08140 [Gemmatimonadetes bacterium]|nr:hypothetical protein [Gemmatimonadota bacterium]